VQPAFLPPSELPERRLVLFTVGRLAVATLLLSGTLNVALIATPSLWSFTPSFLAALIAATYTVALTAAVWLRRAPTARLVAQVQVAADILLTTGMVYVTGGTSSGFTFLYGISVLLAALVAGAPTARAAGTAAIGLYLTMTIGVAAHWISAPPDQQSAVYLLPVRELAFATVVNALGLLVVTFLSSNLAARIQTTGGLLRAAEQSVAGLARLNDDIVRSLTSGLITTDREGMIQMINPTGLQTFKTDAASVLTTDVRGLLPLADLLTTAHSDRDPKRHEGTARRGDGAPFPIGYSVTPLMSASGSASGWIIVFQDLTEIVQLRADAERAQRLVALGHLASGLAHEIRNPLSSIAGSVELVRESPHLDEEERHLLGIVLTESARLNELVSTMLQVGKPMHPRRTEIDLAQVVRDVSAIAQADRGEAAGIRIRHKADHAVLASVDVDQIRQVLWNLLKNAIQASPADSTVEIRVEDQGEFAMLAVADQGAGIDPAQRERIFDMFYSERTHGAGIGLALVRQIVDAHGGTIEAVSNEDAGATFRVTLPKHMNSGATRPARNQ
jgi:two-component system sensor histidine kinase PilS (NtrC family)